MCGPRKRQLFKQKILVAKGVDSFDDIFYFFILRSYAAFSTALRMRDFHSWY